jgi:excisionase family DNA binding protein
MGIETEQEKRDRLVRWDALFARMQRESFAEIERLLPKPRRQRHPRERKPDDPMTMREAAARLGCSIKTLDGHIASGALRYVNIGHGSKRERKRITPADLNAFIEAQTRKDVACPSTEPRARRTGSSTFSGEVIAFTALPRPAPGVKPKK